MEYRTGGVEVMSGVVVVGRGGVGMGGVGMGVTR